MRLISISSVDDVFVVPPSPPKSAKIRFKEHDQDETNGTIKPLYLDENTSKRRVIEMQQSALEENKRLADFSSELQYRLAEYFRDQKVHFGFVVLMKVTLLS